MTARRLVYLAIGLSLLGVTIASTDDGPSTVPDNTIYGHVFDAKTGKPLPSALMYCATCSPNMTNNEGYYEFSRCFSALTAYTIRCVKDGYREYSRTVTTDLKGKAQVDFYVQHEAKAVHLRSEEFL